MRALVLAFTLLVVALPAQAGMLVHGNWCGPGNRGLPPVDQLDAACMRHDACYDRMGSGNCGCDQAFLNELRHTRWVHPELGKRARAVYDAISLTPCAGPGMFTKPANFVGELVQDTVTGRSAPWCVPIRMGKLLTDGW